MQTISQAGSSPISLAVFKDHARIYHDADDVNARSALDSAFAAWTADTLRPMVDTTFEQEFSEVPAGYRFQAGPVASIESVKWYHADTQAENTVSASDYRVAHDGAWPSLQFLYDYAGDESDAGRWVVRWVASWSPEPDAIRAVLMLASSFYDERDQLSPLDLRPVGIGWRSIVRRYGWPNA